MRTLSIYFLNNFHILMYNSVNYTYHVVHCIPSVILPYFITGSLYLLTTFIQFPLPTTPFSGNHRLELFVYGFVCFWSIIDPQKYVSSCYMKQRFDFSLHFKMITTTNQVTISYHIKLLHIYWLHCPHCTFHAHDSFILQLEVSTS